MMHVYYISDGYNICLDIQIVFWRPNDV